MLTRDRPEFTGRAEACFDSQSYPVDRRMLVKLDTSASFWRSMSFGAMRNAAMQAALAANHSSVSPDIILHWDDDDWHGPDRITRQVEQLVNSAKACVGLSSGLFYERITGRAWEYKSSDPNYTFGASLCYHADAWKRTPFPTDSTSSDEMWSEIVGRRGFGWEPEPFMICEVHGGNHGTRIIETASEWSRKPDRDAWCAERLAVHPV